jgi:serine protease Do
VSSGTVITNQTTNITVTETMTSVAQAVAQKCNDSVVGIRVTATVISTGIFGQQTSSQVQSDGSGVIYTQDGYIITNYHVISAAVENASYGTIAEGSKIEVYLPEDIENGISASVVGYDAGADIALLKIDRKNLPAVELGDSSQLAVGQMAVAIGSPGGLEYMGSVSMGIVSGLNRSITTESGVQMNLIQTDAAINPGNSGGALLDETGKLIGINNAKMSGTDYDGMGFAIPVNEVAEICNRLIRQEGAEQAYLGVSINTYYTASRLQAMGYPAGVVIYSVAADSPAEKAGLQPNDLITEFNGTAISSYAAMISEKNKYASGTVVTLKIVRNRQYRTVQVTLG